ncbi:MAG TPA: alpha/beta hydrolase-fold protein [Gemmatimonadota bacterium]|nr:alpha/beta hydrolase-fold protein [Gemmatimonadota bacterium]
MQPISPAFRLAALIAIPLLLIPPWLRAQPAGRVIPDPVPAPSLAGNLLGDAERQAAFVYLPPGYDAEPDRRYPVLYLLHGVLDSPEVWVEPMYDGMTIQATMDSLIAAGEIGPAIVVVPNGRNAYGGSYYANSPVTGGWGDWIAKDLVAHVDQTYRTLAAPESRAILGHSMGGLGAIRLAMLHPDVFSVAWGMNPCCLCCLEADIAEDVELWTRIASYRSAEEMWAALEEKEDFWPMVVTGISAAFAPAPDAPPLYVELPARVEGGEVVRTAAADRIAAALPLAMVAGHADALRSLRGLAFDTAFDDEFAHIPLATKTFSDSLEALEVPHLYEVYAGDHRNRMRERLATKILPWIDARLQH